MSWVLYPSDELGLWRLIKDFLYVYYEELLQEEFSIFFVSSTLYRALYVKDTSGKKYKQINLLRLQIHTFIWVTLKIL